MGQHWRTVANLHLALNSTARASRVPRFLAMTDEVRGGHPLELAQRLPRACGLILRHYGDPARQDLAREVARICRRRGVICLVAGDARLAVAVGAAGVHLPEHQLRSRAVCRGAFHRSHQIVTAAVHSRTALNLARRAGVDAALVSPVFPTASHPEAPVLGPLRFAAMARTAGVPVYALGGIDETGLKRLSASGCAGFAGIGLFE